jgi:serine/threonine protein kinase
MSLRRTNDAELDPEEPVYALKSIIKAYVHDDRKLEEMRNEIYTMSHLQHENVVRVHEAYERKRHIYLIMEYCSGGDLWARSDHCTEEQAAAVIYKILQAVAYLHDHKVVHRDLKLENIMFSSTSPHADVKIIDFGLATRYLSDEHKRMTDRVGTLYSMAPQVLQGVYDAKCDLWSIGVIAYVLLSQGKQPFWGPPREMPWEQRKKIMIDRIMRCDYMRMTGPSWNNRSKEAKEFVKALLRMDPSRRPSATKALQLPWLAQAKEIVLVDMNLSPSEDHTELEEWKRRVRELLAERLSEEDLLKLKAVLEKSDKEEHISVKDLVATLSKLRSLAGPDLSRITPTHSIESLSIEYLDLLGAALDTKGRQSSERMAEIFAELNIDPSGRLPKSQAKVILKKVLTERTLTMVLNTIQEDKYGLVSCRDIFDLVEKQNLDMIEEVQHSEREEVQVEERDLVTAENALIPGGRFSERPEYVYDSVSESLRKANPS